jgi:hypothetical protein
MVEEIQTEMEEIDEFNALVGTNVLIKTTKIEDSGSGYIDAPYIPMEIISYSNGKKVN